MHVMTSKAHIYASLNMDKHRTAAKRRRPSLWTLFRLCFWEQNWLGLSLALVFATLLVSVVTWFLDGMLMSAVGYYTAGKPLRNVFLVYGGGSYNTLAEASAAGVAVFAYGAFLEALSAFVVAALVVFCVIAMYRRYSGHYPDKVTLGEEAVIGLAYERSALHHDLLR